MSLPRNDDGNLPAYAWPGGYPIYYLTADNGCLCPGCANGENGSDASETNEDKSWRVVAYGIHYEGDPIICDHCGGENESAYGPLEE
jgi:hypothetical protein